MYNTTFWILIIFIFILLACISRNMSKENFLLNTNKDMNLLKNLNKMMIFIKLKNLISKNYFLNMIKGNIINKT